MTYVMKMPESYSDVSKEEMEYDGGAWFVVCGLISIGCSLASIGLDVAYAAGLPINQETKRNISRGLAIVGTVTGIASGLGFVYSAAGNVAKGAFCLADTVFSDTYTTATW